LGEYLRDHNETDFKSGEDFADKLLDELGKSFENGWSSTRAVQAIKRTTKSIYEFFRLKDTTPFGDKSPIKLKLGGADTKSIKFIGDLDHFYFSKFAKNTSEPLRKFFVEQYFENGAALFGRESSEELEEFRKVAGERLKNLTDRQTKTILQTAVQRVRNWAHIGSLSQARIRYARYAATLDSRTTEICRGIDGKKIKVGVAQTAIERLNQLEPGEFALELYESNAAKAFRKDPVGWLETEIDENGFVSEEMTKNGLALPPLHPNCRTRLEGLIKGIDEDA
jgi:hypothetical protein